MAGYQYRATPARARAAEALMRSRGIDDVRTAAEVPEPVATVTQTGDVFEVVKEEPRPVRLPRRSGTLRAAALSAVKVLEENPGEWFRVAKRGTKSKSYSYTATLRTVTKQSVQTRIVEEDGEFIIYARTKVKEAQH